MEAFFKTHKYLVEHLHAPVRRGLMDEIDWNDRLIGIKGSRGVGKTTFLLDYAREHFGADNKECLYINLNHFYFTERTLVDFASEFRAKGGKVLLIDQVFKYSGWSKELRYCYDNFEDLKIIFSGSSVMRLKEENPDLSGKVVSYNLRGFSFREFLNLMSGNSFPAYTFEEIIGNHQEIAKNICSVSPDCGSPEEMQRRLAPYRSALVVQSKWPITDYSDFAAIKAAKQWHNRKMLLVIDRLKQEGHRGKMAGASCCTLCERCAILDSQPCRDPERQFSCLSAYCIYVKALAEACGMEYTCADGQLALFGMYAF